MILGENFAVSQIDQRSMWSGGGSTEVMALAGSRCERVRRLGILCCGIAMRLGHSSSHVGKVISFFAVATLDSGAGILYPSGDVVARVELLLTGLAGTNKTDRDFLAHPMSIVHDDAWPTAEIYKRRRNCVEAPMYSVSTAQRSNTTRKPPEPTVLIAQDYFVGCLYL